MEQLSLEERVVKAARVYMERVHEAEYIGESCEFMVMKDEEGVIFVAVDYALKAFPEFDERELRRDFEEAMILWFSEPENRATTNIPIRCDHVGINVIHEDRALVRHLVNAVGEQHEWH